MKQKRIIFMLLALLLASLACNLPAQGGDVTPTVNMNTAIALTLTAVQPGQAASNTPSGPTATPTANGAPTQTPPADTPVPSATAALPPTAMPLACNAAAFMADITIPDGTTIVAGTGFTKTWQLKNVGTCTWTPSYQIIFVSGEAMGAPSGISMTSANIPPNGLMNVSLTMTAPVTPGSYQGYFKLRAPDNTTFGIGNSGADPFWVKINSGAAAATAVPATAVPAPTAVPTLGIIKIPTLKIPILFLKPDLRVTNITVSPLPAHSNANQSVHVTIYNGGNWATNGNFTVRFWGYPGDPGGCTWNVSLSIPSGGGQVLACNYIWSQAYLNGVTTTATVDTGNTINESDETNNSMQLFISKIN